MPAFRGRLFLESPTKVGDFVPRCTFVCVRRAIPFVVDGGRKRKNRNGKAAQLFFISGEGSGGGKRRYSNCLKDFPRTTNKGVVDESSRRPKVMKNMVFSFIAQFSQPFFSIRDVPGLFARENAERRSQVSLQFLTRNSRWLHLSWRGPLYKSTNIELPLTMRQSK